MAVNIIFALVIIALIAGVFYWLWKLSKWLVIPIQIILFITLVFIVFKVFVNKENAEKLHKELKNSGIVEVEKKIISQTTNTLKNTLPSTSKDDVKNVVSQVVQPTPVKEKVQQDTTPVAKPAPAAKPNIEKKSDVPNF